MSVAARKYLDSLEPEEIVQLLGDRERLIEVALAIVQELNEVDGGRCCTVYPLSNPIVTRCQDPGQHEARTDVWSVGRFGNHSQPKLYGTSMIDGLARGVVREA